MGIPLTGKKTPCSINQTSDFLAYLLSMRLNLMFFSKDLLGEISHESTEIHPLLGHPSECFQIPYINTSIEFVTNTTGLCQKVYNKMLAGYQTTNPLGLA